MTFEGQIHLASPGRCPKGRPAPEILGTEAKTNRLNMGLRLEVTRLVWAYAVHDRTEVGDGVKIPPLPIEDLMEDSRKPKKVPNTIKGRRKGTGPDLVDQQIILWRKALKKAGKTTGRHRDKQLKQIRESQETLKERKAIASGKKKYFE